MVRLKSRHFALLAIGLAFALHAVPATAQNTCKGLAKDKCESSASCSWVSGYKTKSGTAVKSYCRTSPGKGAAKKDAAKSKASEKAKAAKARASDKSKAMTTKAKSQSVKAKTKADKATTADRKASSAATKAAKDAANKAKTK